MGYIVVGVDSSETSRAAFRDAVQEAVWRKCSILAIHVVASPVLTGYEFSVVAFDIDEIRKFGTEFLDAEIAEIEKEYEGGFPVAVEKRVVLGHTGTEIIRASQDSDGKPAELVVLGSRGMGGFRGLLLGSVTTYAMHHLSCRLLVVPTKDEDQ